MDDRGLHARLSNLINEFSYQYSVCSVDGALVQLWTRHTSQDGGESIGVLSTQNAPFAIMGSSDQLVLYKYESSKYHPRCDGAVAACAISRVFASLQPELTGDDSKEPDKVFDRAAQAQRCGIHSNLLLAVYDVSLMQPDAVAVFELAQHEVGVDFTLAVNILQEVAKEHSFWIPSYQSARSVNDCEEAVELLQHAPAASSSGRSRLSSINASLGALAQKAMRQPTPPCAKAARQRVRGYRRCACLLADTPPDTAASYEGSAAVEQQQQQAREQGRAPHTRRPSVIYTNHTTPAVEAFPSTGTNRKSRSGRHRQELAEQQQLTQPLQQQQHPQPLHSLQDGGQLPYSASSSGHSSMSSVASLNIPPSKSGHHSQLSARRRSYDGCCTLSKMGRAHSSYDTPQSSSNSGWSQRVAGLGIVNVNQRRAATPPPNEFAGWHQNWSQASSRFAHSSSGGSSTISAQELQHQQHQQLFAPFQSGTPPSAPTRCFTPAHHPHRHITSRTASLQAMLGGAKAKRGQGQEQERRQAELQQQRDQQLQEGQLQQHWQDLERQQQHTLVRQQQQEQQCAYTHMAADVQCMTTPEKQQQDWHDPFAAAAQRPSFGGSRTVSDAQLLQARAPAVPSPNTEPLPQISASAPSSIGGHSGKARVRALVAHGGSFKHTGVGGNWEYMGGAQKLVGVPRSAGVVELQRQLSSIGAGTGQECKLKYALPGSTAGATTYVDLETEEDVETMWEEIEDYTSTHQGFKLQLYVESVGTASSLELENRSSLAFGGSSAHASSESGRDSGGSEIIKLGSGGLLAQRQVGSGTLQPSTPAQSGALPSTPAFTATTGHLDSTCCPPTEHLSQLGMAQVSSDPWSSLRSPSGAVSGAMYAAAAAAAAAAMAGGNSSAVGHLQDEQRQCDGKALVPIYSGLPLQDSNTLPSAGSSGFVAAAAVTGVDIAPQGSDDSESYLAGVATSTAMEAAAQQYAAQARQHASAAGMKKLRAHAAGLAAVGEDSNCNNSNGSVATGVATAASSTASSINSTHSRSRHAAGPLLSEGSATQMQSYKPASMHEVIHQKHEHLKQLIAELEGRVEIITPHDLNIVRFLGGGAFGEVYLTKWHGTDVAVKCLSPSLIAGEQSTGSPCADAVAELLKEAAVLASLHHPNIVSVFGVVLPPSELFSSNSVASELEQPLAEDGVKSRDDILVEELTDELLAGELVGNASAFAGQGSGSSAPSRLGMSLGVQSFAGCRAAMASALSQGHPPAPAIVTEYLSLGSLRSAISNRAEWLKGSLARAKLMLDTARGLDYLHSKRLVHFDLKSANLLVTMKDKVPCIKVADMGLTKQRRQTFVSGVNTLRGTLPWIAPEIVKNPDSVTEKADCWSFGVVMWELWTMQEPFEGVHLHALLHQLATPAGLSLPVPGTPEWTDADCPPEPAPGWCALMRRCWLPPDERPSSRQLVVALDDMMDQIRARRRSGRTSEASAAAGRG